MLRMMSLHRLIVLMPLLPHYLTAPLYRLSRIRQQPCPLWNSNFMRIIAVSPMKKLKKLGITLLYPSYREGLSTIFKEMQHRIK